MKNGINADSNVIELPGLLTLEWLPGVQRDPELKEALAEVIYSGGLEPMMRAEGISEKTIELYREALRLRGQQ